MRTLPLALLTACCFLAGCNPNTTNIATQNSNPLTASRYGDELADTLANFIISKDPITERDGMKEFINTEIAKAKEISLDAREKQSHGLMGRLIPLDNDAVGLALYLESTLYFSSDFLVDPGPSLHVYLTEMVDPRDGVFPDDTAVDLGEVQATYGAQQYGVNTTSDKLRTLVFWDKKLQKIYGFAQLSRRE